MFKIKTVIGAVILCLGVSAYAANKDWTETFDLKGGNWVQHTPDYVLFDGFLQAGKELNLSGSFNGTEISPCGLHLKTDSTREEFVTALKCSGLYQ